MEYPIEYQKRVIEAYSKDNGYDSPGTQSKRLKQLKQLLQEGNYTAGKILDTTNIKLNPKEVLVALETLDLKPLYIQVKAMVERGQLFDEWYELCQAQGEPEKSMRK